MTFKNKIAKTLNVNCPCTENHNSNQISLNRANSILTELAEFNQFIKYIYKRHLIIETNLIIHLLRVQVNYFFSIGRFVIIPLVSHVGNTKINLANVLTQTGQTSKRYLDRLKEK